MELIFPKKIPFKSCYGGRRDVWHCCHLAEAFWWRCYGFVIFHADETSVLFHGRPAGPYSPYSFQSNGVQKRAQPHLGHSSIPEPKFYIAIFQKFPIHPLNILTVLGQRVGGIWNIYSNTLSDCGSPCIAIVRSVPKNRAHLSCNWEPLTSSTSSSWVPRLLWPGNDWPSSWLWDLGGLPLNFLAEFYDAYGSTDKLRCRRLPTLFVRQICVTEDWCALSCVLRLSRSRMGGGPSQVETLNSTKMAAIPDRMQTKSVKRKFALNQCIQQCYRMLV